MQFEDIKLVNFEDAALPVRPYNDAINTLLTIRFFSHIT